MTAVYWIRHPDHTDIFSQGYVGISNRINRRFWEHKKLTKNVHFKNAIEKYGWDNLVKQIVLIADEKYCLEIEQKLRSTDQIGWNIINGGGMPPKLFGNKINAGRTPWNKGMRNEYTTVLKGVPRTEELKQKLRRLVTCPHCNQTGGLGGMVVNHFNNCKGPTKTFRARITVNGKRVSLGMFATKQEAVDVEIKAYQEAKLPIPQKFLIRKKEFIMNQINGATSCHTAS